MSWLVSSGSRTRKPWTCASLSGSGSRATRPRSRRRRRTASGARPNATGSSARPSRPRRPGLLGRLPRRQRPRPHRNLSSRLRRRRVRPSTVSCARGQRASSPSRSKRASSPSLDLRRPRLLDLQRHRRVRRRRGSRPRQLPRRCDPHLLRGATPAHQGPPVSRAQSRLADHCSARAAAPSHPRPGCGHRAAAPSHRRQVSEVVARSLAAVRRSRAQAGPLVAARAARHAPAALAAHAPAALARGAPAEGSVAAVPQRAPPAARDVPAPAVAVDRRSGGLSGDGGTSKSSSRSRLRSTRRRTRRSPIMR